MLPADLWARSASDSDGSLGSSSLTHEQSNQTRIYFSFLRPRAMTTNIWNSSPLKSVPWCFCTLKFVARVVSVP